MNEHEVPLSASVADAEAPEESLPRTAPAQADVTGDASLDAGDSPPLRQLLEAILLVVDEPVTEVELAQVVEAPTAVVAAALAELSLECVAAGRGYELRQVAGGWRFYTAAACAPWVERFVREGQRGRLSQAALETLAIIAYRQPVSRQAISGVRGVNVDSAVRSLVGRGLVVELGQDPSSGAHLYGTTPTLLERLGLASLDELPALAPLLPQSVEDVEAEL